MTKIKMVAGALLIVCAAYGGWQMSISVRELYFDWRFLRLARIEQIRRDQTRQQEAARQQAARPQAAPQPTTPQP